MNYVFDKYMLDMVDMPIIEHKAITKHLLIFFCFFVFFLMFFMVMGGSSGDFYYFFDFQRQLNDQEKHMKKMSMSK